MNFNYKRRNKLERALISISDCVQDPQSIPFYFYQTPIGCLYYFIVLYSASQLRQLYTICICDVLNHLCSNVAKNVENICVCSALFSHWLLLCFAQIFSLIFVSMVMMMMMIAQGKFINFSNNLFTCIWFFICLFLMRWWWTKHLIIYYYFV